MVSFVIVILLLFLLLQYVVALFIMTCCYCCGCEIAGCAGCHVAFCGAMVMIVMQCVKLFPIISVILISACHHCY